MARQRHSSVGVFVRSFPALGAPNYRLYWLGQFITLTGSWMQHASLPWLVLILGGTPLQLGLVVALQFAPEMLLSPFAGVFADRLDKRRLLIATQVLAMLPPAILFVLAVSGTIQLPHVFVLALAFGVVNRRGAGAPL